MKEYQIIFLGNTPFEVIGCEGKLKEFGNHQNQVDLHQQTVIDNKYQFLYNRSLRNIEVDPVPENLGEYIPISLWADVASGDRQLEGWETRHINNKHGELGVYYADSFMRKYLNGFSITFDFAGDAFALDVANWKLFEVASPANIIRLNEVEYWGERGYAFEYDPIHKNILRGDSPLETPNTVYLDQMVCYDPVGMAKRYRVDLCRLPRVDIDPGDTSLEWHRRPAAWKSVCQMRDIQRKPISEGDRNPGERMKKRNGIR